MESTNVASTFPLEVGVQCENLCLFDGETNLNPICVMYKMYQNVKYPPSQHNDDSSNISWNEIGRTEKLSSNKEPNWKNKIEFDYTFGDHVTVKFDVYHVLENTDWGLLRSSGMDDGPSSHELIGTLEAPLGTLLTCKDGKHSTSLRLNGMSDDWIKTLGDSSLPKIHLEIREKDEIRKIVDFEVRAEYLDNKDFMGKSDPYLSIYSQSVNGQLTLVYKSEIIMDNLHPKWKPFKIELGKLCNGDYNKRIRMEVHDYDSIGSHDFIGSFVTTMNQLQNNIQNELRFPITNDDKKGEDKRSGSVIVVRRDVETIPTFVSLLQTGTNINLSIAIDFTQSNGDPNDKSSLHHLPLGSDNLYSFVTRSVIEGMNNFSSVQSVDCYGYGAKLPQQQKTSHVFPLNLSSNPSCAGLDEVLKGYQNCVKDVTFSGPCNLSPIINHVTKHAQTFMVDGKQYFVLLILTNGDINDFEETRSAISSVSDWPISIVVAGIGNRDFSQFDELKFDPRANTSTTTKRKSKLVAAPSARSNYHFVDIKTQMPSTSIQNFTRISKENAQRNVAKELLSQVPRQFAEWMQKSGKIKL